MTRYTCTNQCDGCDTRCVEPEPHPDDVAVDEFAKRMKAKLALTREKGRDGWDDPAKCSIPYLSVLLEDHIDKGDPMDVANLAMMIEIRGERIASHQERDDERERAWLEQLADAEAE